MPAVDQAPPTPCPICDPCGGGCDHEGAPGHRPRTLPVTPAERALAAVLRAWRDWPGDGCEPEDEDMLDVGAVLRAAGLIDAGEVSARGAALLARVEAAPVPDPMIAFEAAIRDAATKGGPYCVTHARDAVAALDAARLAGTTPIDAPPAKEPR